LNSKDVWSQIRKTKKEGFRDSEKRKLEDSGGICCMCKKYVGKEKLTLDHIFPISKASPGRIYTINDIQPLCSTCNSKKHNKII
jgi:5-methylcytosine-specific restriction endonuclease McrA